MPLVPARVVVALYIALLGLLWPHPQAGHAAGIGAAAASDVAARAPQSTVDGPQHHFGFAPANVIAQTTATLTLTTSGSPAVVSVGEQLTYTASIETFASSREGLPDLTVTDLLPANVTLVSAASSLGTCAAGPGAQAVVCSLGTVRTRLTITITIVVAVNPAAAGSTLTNRVSAAVGTQFGFESTIVTPVNPLAPSPLTSQQAIQQAQGAAGFGSGQAGRPCGDTPGQACSGSGGGLSALGTVTSSMRWTLTATLPAAPLAGPGMPLAVFTTTSGLEAVPCAPALTPAPAPGAQVTCTATTAGNALQGSTVALVLPGVAGVAGPVVGPAVVSGSGSLNAAVAPPAARVLALPLLPPPPPALLPPPPLPPISPPALAVAGPLAMPPGVPVVPEADPGALILLGLLGLAGLGAWRGRRRRG